MKLSNLLEKLRKSNKGDYRQFSFCVFFSVMLISSFLLLMYSPLVQGSMPEGGDTRKQISLTLGIAVVGCTMFALYAVKLFLRYKSREIGIFLALGTERGQLKKALYTELGKMMALYSFAGILAGAILALLTGKAAEILVAGVNEYPFAYTIKGFVGAVCYAVFLFLLIMWQASGSMKRTNVMDVINEQRKQEPMKKAVTGKYLAWGIGFVIVGIFGAMILPNITATVFHVWLGGWSNLFYLMAVVGVYRMLVYSVSCHKKGKHPAKYYKNLLNYGMMKFQGASVVKNMLVITLLIMGGLYSIYYLPQAAIESKTANSRMEDEYSFRYTEDSEELSEKEIVDLAGKYNLTVENYREAELIKVKGSGINRDIGEDGRGIEDYYDEYMEYECISASEFQRVTGKKADIAKGSYALLVGSDAAENVWNCFDDIDKLYCQADGTYLPLTYQKNVEYQCLTLENGMGMFSRLVLNDNDYKKLRQGLSEGQIVTYVLFNTEGEKGEIPFAKALWKEYGNRISDRMNVMMYYNPCEAKRQGKDYQLNGEVMFDPEQPDKESDWQYAPDFLPLKNQQTIMLLAVRFMLFSYVFIICMAAVGVIGYTRSQNVGISNAQVFSDIEKLGADKHYLRKLLVKQIKKYLFFRPSLVPV